MARWPNIDLVLPAIVDHSSVRIVADLVSDHRTLDDMPRLSHIVLDHPAAAMVPSSDHTAVASITDNRNSDITPAVTADTMVASVDTARCTADGSDRTVVTPVLSSVHIVVALATVNRTSDTMLADTAGSTTVSVGTCRRADIILLNKVLITDVISARIMVDLSLVRETAIVFRNLVLAR